MNNRSKYYFFYTNSNVYFPQVLNLYESPAGFGLSLLRCISWCVFMISTAATIRKYPEKSSFYYPFGLLGSVWILGGPFLTLIGIGILDAWVRESVMYLTFAMLAFMGHATFLVTISFDLNLIFHRTFNCIRFYSFDWILINLLIGRYSIKNNFST